jgi:hypothetical protein
MKPFFNSLAKWPRPRKSSLPLVLVLAISSGANAAHRSHSAKAAFRRAHPCPATGSPRGACPGYVIDHVTPLCAGGPDAPGNMQWQTVEEAKVKDREERRMCKR